VRIDVGWRALEPDRAGTIASWYLRLVEFTVDQARARGINVILTLWNSPAWANGGLDWNVPPTNPAEYGRIAGYLANYFRGRVAAWEIWNEPDLGGFFTGSVSQYVGLLRAAYPTIKAADPSTKVLAGATEMNDTTYLASMYAAGAKGYFDVISTHPYMGPADAPPELPDDGNPWRIDHVRAVRALMVANGDGNKPIWFTEMGWSSHATAAGAPTWKRGVSEAQQADFAVRALKFVGANHPYVDVMIWYNERAKTTGDIHEDNYGLMTRDLQPKPVYTAVDNLLS
jgi:polysaccharide biosynthesis protein PslG